MKENEVGDGKIFDRIMRSQMRYEKGMEDLESGKIISDAEGERRMVVDSVVRSFLQAEKVYNSKNPLDSLIFFHQAMGKISLGLTLGKIKDSDLEILFEYSPYEHDERTSDKPSD